MASPYSDDLRRKFLEAYQRGDGSLPALAGRFGVSLGWAEKIWRTMRRTGRMERPPGSKRGPASKVTADVQERLRGWVKEQPDLTLEELRKRLARQVRLPISVSRLWTVLAEMGLRLKKSRSTPPSKTLLRANSSAAYGAQKRATSIRQD
jgi:transposase